MASVETKVTQLIYSISCLLMVCPCNGPRHQQALLLSWCVSNQTCHKIIQLNNLLPLSWKVTALICQLLSLIKLFSQSLSSSTWKHYPLYEPVEPIHWSTNCIKHNFTAQLYIHAHHYRLSWGSFSDMWLNSLDPGRFGCNFKLVICKIISMG